MLVDHSFIKRLEGLCLVGYVPDFQNSNSGVTIASGFDIGHRKKRFIKSNFPTELACKLAPYCGYFGAKAKNRLDEKPLQITSDEADLINELVQTVALKKLLKNWKAGSNTPFTELSIEQRTVVASVAFQYGTLRTKTPNFWRQVTTGDWEGALKNLRNFGDRYSTRRNKEADLLQSNL